MFFVHHLYVILDKLYSEHTIENPTDSDLESLEETSTNGELITQPPQNSTKIAKVVTPNPSSPKKRKTDEILLFDLEMDLEFATSLIEKIIFITWNEIHAMNFDTVKQYLQAHALVEKSTIFLNHFLMIH